MTESGKMCTHITFSHEKCVKCVLTSLFHMKDVYSYKMCTHITVM